MTMWDSTDPGQIPVGVPIVAGYIDGLYKWPVMQWFRLSSSERVQVTVFGAAYVQVCDCESGDLSPVEAASWAVGELWYSRRPTIYCNLSTWPYVIQALKLHGVNQSMIDWWIADPTGVPHLVPGSVATQDRWHSLGQTGPLNVDLSTTNGIWPATITPVASTAPRPATVAIIDCPTGGYWEIGADGGVFAWGCAFYGSLGGQKLSAPITSGCATASGKGYRLAGADGAIYCFGDASYLGGTNV